MRAKYSKAILTLAILNFVIIMLIQIVYLKKVLCQNTQKYNVEKRKVLLLLIIYNISTVKTKPTVSKIPC